MTYKLNLKKFDLNMIKDDAVCVFIGRRRTGKSYCLKDLLFRNRDIPFGTVISATEDASPFFEDFVPKSYIFTEFKEEIVKDIINRQKKILKTVQTQKLTNVDPRVFIVLDDCLYDDSWSRTKAIRNIFMNGRHYKILFCLTMQYPLGVPPALRSNIDYTIIMREPYISNRKKIYENYAGMFPDFSMFCQVMDSLQQYECLILNNNADSNKLKDQVFWYKADKRDNFKMGGKQYWDYHNKNYNKIKAKREETTNIEDYQRKNRVTLDINKYE
tara:strand:+ start:4228 stop:5043 length:816 start_codon:yes stop_codon:yes gene_type:complete